MFDYNINRQFRTAEYPLAQEEGGIDVKMNFKIGENVFMTRTYDYVIAIRSINTVDAVTAEVVQLPWELLFKMSERIIAEVDGVNRVVYDITQKPPGTIEWE